MTVPRATGFRYSTGKPFAGGRERKDIWQDWSGAEPTLSRNPQDTEEDAWAAKQLNDLSVTDQGDGVTLEVIEPTKYDFNADGLRRATTAARLTEVFTPKKTSETE